MQFKTETKVGIFILVAIGIFAYMTIYMGLFRLNLQKYNKYNIYFEDISGLAKKSDVKIAGVKVGWIDLINLIEGGSRARIRVLVEKKYILHSDAYGEIRQDGMLGSKYLEIVPGSPSAGDIPAGSTLIKEGKSQVSVEDLLSKVKNITENIESVSGALRYAMGGEEQSQSLKNLIDNISRASESISKISEVVAQNSQNVNNVIERLSSFSSKLDQDIVPVIQNTLSKIENTTNSLSSITNKVDEGDGFLAKIINDEEVFDDVKTVAKTLRSSVDTLNSLELVIDSHWESMYRPAEFFYMEDSKGYLDFRLHTSEDKFYIFQILSSIKGNLERDIDYNEYANNAGIPLSDKAIDDLPVSFSLQPFEGRHVKRIPNSLKYGFQFGKIFSDVCLRFGLIEQSAGIGIDYEIPFASNKFRWVTTFEAFDFRGQDRIDDTRPHLKWINRMFLFDTFYLAFGADDFVSRRNANAFFGGGFRFTDDDVKDIITKLSFFVTSISGQS